MWRNCYFENHLKVLLVTSQDDDFDVDLMARGPGNLIDMEMVKVRPGQVERFQEKRAAYKTRARNSKDVIDVVTFDVDRTTLQRLPEGNPFRIDTSDTELTITLYRSSEARARALASNLKEADYASTFDCVACALINADLDPADYGPFPEDELNPAYP